MLKKTKLFLFSAAILCVVPLLVMLPQVPNIEPIRHATDAEAAQSVIDNFYEASEAKVIGDYWVFAPDKSTSSSRTSFIISPQNENTSTVLSIGCVQWAPYLMVIRPEPFEHSTSVSFAPYYLRLDGEPLSDTFFQRSQISGAIGIFRHQVTRLLPKLYDVSKVEILDSDHQVVADFTVQSINTALNRLYAECEHLYSIDFAVDQYRILQRALIESGLDAKTEKETEAAIEELQRQLDLPVTGVFTDDVIKVIREMYFDR